MQVTPDFVWEQFFRLHSNYRTTYQAPTLFPVRFRPFPTQFVIGAFVSVDPFSLDLFFPSCWSNILPPPLVSTRQKTGSSRAAAPAFRSTNRLGTAYSYQMGDAGCPQTSPAKYTTRGLLFSFRRRAPPRFLRPKVIAWLAIADCWILSSGCHSLSGCQCSSWGGESLKDPQERGHV